MERRAYRMAVVATRDQDEAVDIVQDAMLKLATRYHQRPPEEWGPLFQTILQSTINDWHRRHKVRSGILRLFGVNEREEEDGADAYAADGREEPERQLRNSAALDALEAALHSLPLRQQQVFLLREWEGLDVQETAAALNISGGSVKTHYSRAVHALREKLEGHWP